MVLGLRVWALGGLGFGRARVCCRGLPKLWRGHPEFEARKK